jgi:hypothetical protein
MGYVYGMGTSPFASIAACWMTPVDAIGSLLTAMTDAKSITSARCERWCVLRRVVVKATSPTVASSTPARTFFEDIF